MTATLQKYFAPLVLVFPRDANNDAGDKLRSLAITLRHRIWEFGEGLGFALEYYEGPCRRHGGPLDDAEFLRRTRPFSRSCDNLIGRTESIENATVPDTQFWLRFILKGKEQDSAFCMYMRSKVNTLNSIRVRCYRRRQLTSESTNSIQRLLVSWSNLAFERGFHGETLKVRSINIVPFRGQMDGYDASGVEFDLPDYGHAVTWPWVALYLQIRAAFSAKERFSIEFTETQHEATNGPQNVPV